MSLDDDSTEAGELAAWSAADLDGVDHVSPGYAGANRFVGLNIPDWMWLGARSDADADVAASAVEAVLVTSAVLGSDARARASSCARTGARLEALAGWAADALSAVVKLARRRRREELETA